MVKDIAERRRREVSGPRAARFTIRKPSGKVILLSFFFLFVFRIFQYFPGFKQIREVWLVCVFFYLVGPYTYDRLRNGVSLIGYELYILFIMVFIPLLTGITAWREFGQPPVYGILAQRTLLLGAGALALVHAFRRGWLALQDIERALLLAAWGTLLLYLLLNSLLDPARFSDFHGGFVGGGSIEQAEFKFSPYFIVFAFFYYFFMGFRTRSLKDYALATPFFIYLVLIDGGRSLIVSVLGAVLFFVFRWASFLRIATFIPKIVVGISVLLAPFIFFNADNMIHLAGKFSDAFTVVLTGEQSEDVSANARLLETATALPYIQKHWLLGNGDISRQWHGGYEGVLGAYFYPSDVGIIGTLYLYGLIGLILFAIQFAFAIRFANKMGMRGAMSSLTNGVKGFLMYFAIHSLVTGRFAHHSEVSFLFIAILYCVSLETRRHGPWTQKPATGGGKV